MFGLFKNKEKINDISIEYSPMIKKIESMEGSIDKLCVQIEYCVDTISALNKNSTIEIATKEIEIEAMKQEIELINNKNNAILEENTQLSATVNKLQEALESLGVDFSNN